MKLKLVNIYINYGGVEAVKNVSLEISEGSLVTLIGSNGAGKTSILKAISGLVHPTSGEIWFGNNRIEGWTPKDIARTGISHVLAGGGLFSTLSVLKNLKLGAFLRKDKKTITEDLDELFERFPILKKRKAQQAGTLSGGEQRMLAVARSLMARPKLLLLDEPSLGLSPLMVKEIASLISEIRKKGTSMLLVEQNAHMALELCDKAYVLQTGKITLEGDGKTLLADEEVKKAYLAI